MHKKHVQLKERSDCIMNQNNATKKLAMAGVLTALAVAGSLVSFPVAGSKCAPIQHMVNVLAAILLGPWWSLGIAFCASLLRNLMGIGSLMAFPGSMVGAFCCGMVYGRFKNVPFTCLAEAAGTGSKASYGGRTGGIVCLCSSVPGFYGSRKYSGLPAGNHIGKGQSPVAGTGGKITGWISIKRTVPRFTA